MSSEDEWAADYGLRSDALDRARAFSEPPPAAAFTDPTFYLSWVVQHCLDWYDEGPASHEAAGRLFFVLVNRNKETELLLAGKDLSVVVTSLSLGREQFEAAMRSLCVL